MDLTIERAAGILKRLPEITFDFSNLSLRGGGTGVEVHGDYCSEGTEGEDRRIPLAEIIKDPEIHFHDECFEEALLGSDIMSGQTERTLQGFLLEAEYLLDALNIPQALLTGGFEDKLRALKKLQLPNLRSTSSTFFPQEIFKEYSGVAAEEEDDSRRDLAKSLVDHHKDEVEDYLKNYFRRNALKPLEIGEDLYAKALAAGKGNKLQDLLDEITAGYGEIYKFKIVFNPNAAPKIKGPDFLRHGKHYHASLLFQELMKDSSGKHLWQVPHDLENVWALLKRSFVVSVETNQKLTQAELLTFEGLLKAQCDDDIYAAEEEDMREAYRSTLALR